jgi:hypothetical protein
VGRFGAARGARQRPQRRPARARSVARTRALLRLGEHAPPPTARPPAAPAPRSEELNQPVFAAIDAFEYPELHDESIAARSFFLHLARLMAVCGVKDFGMKVRRPRRWRWRLRLRDGGGRGGCGKMAAAVAMRSGAVAAVLSSCRAACAPALRGTRTQG